MVWLAVDRSLQTPLIKQLYDQVRLRILRGDLRAGEQVPSSRQLSHELGIARIVVLEAYEQLLAEGYLESRPGAGTYVADGAYLEKTLPAPRFSHLPAESAEPEQHTLIDFRSGLPALDQFPRKLWGQLARQVYMDARITAFGYEQPEGSIELRVALARYLAKTRGVCADPRQILITSGAAQAFSLLVRLLVLPGADVVLEDPGMAEVRTIFSATGGTIRPVPVDEQGLKTDLLPPMSQPGLIFVTPSHQFPLGGILPIQRRIQLIQYARTNGCFILEDDYDSEFRYIGTPVSSLYELAPEQVIYVGTLSKCFYPALRLGYAVLPERLIEPTRRLRRLTDLHSPVPEQLIMAHFLEEGHMERHILKMKRIYRQRRELLIATLQGQFQDAVQISGAATGLHLIADFPGRIFTGETCLQFEHAGVRVYPVEQHALHKELHLSKLILGYGNLQPSQIIEGVHRLKGVLMQRTDQV